MSDTGSESLGGRLDTKLAELRQAIADTAIEVSEAVNTKLDELQAVVAEASTKLDEAQGQASTE